MSESGVAVIKRDGERIKVVEIGIKRSIFDKLKGIFR